MEKIVLYGGGKIGEKVYQMCENCKMYNKEIVAVIDSYKKGFFRENIPFITLQEYEKKI